MACGVHSMAVLAKRLDLGFVASDLRQTRALSGEAWEYAIFGGSGIAYLRNRTCRKRCMVCTELLF